jgi:hypothetical protein
LAIGCHFGYMPTAYAPSNLASKNKKNKLQGDGAAMARSSVR